VKQVTFTFICFGAAAVHDASKVGSACGVRVQSVAYTFAFDYTMKFCSPAMPFILYDPICVALPHTILSKFPKNVFTFVGAAPAGLAQLFACFAVKPGSYVNTVGVTTAFALPHDIAVIFSGVFPCAIRARLRQALANSVSLSPLSSISFSIAETVQMAPFQKVELSTPM